MKHYATFPWYIFLLPLFYVLHAYNEYFGLIHLEIPVRYLTYYFLLSAIILGAGFLLFKNIIKAGVWTVTFLIFFFFFGVAHDFLKNLRLPAFLVSYKLLLSLALILFLLFTRWMKKTTPSLKANRFFQYLFMLLAILEIGISLFYIFSNELKKKDLTGNNLPLDPQLKISNKNQAPDIFFIVFDEYASSKALKEYFHFDNSKLDSSLLNAGFYISTNSQSNYNSTPLSIGSAFNMQYFNKPVEKKPNNTLSLLQGAYSIKQSLLPDLLEQHNYDIINYGLCDIKNHPVSVERVFTEYEKKIFYLETLGGRIQRDILWNLTTRFPGYSRLIPADKNCIARNKKNYTNFLNELSKESDKPKFVFGHVLIPRRPAYLDRNGQPRMMSNEDLTDENHDKLYLEQLIYANTWIDSLMKAATTTPRTRPLVLIIEGDHGNRYSEWGRPIREKQFMNLNTYYFSDKDYSMLYDSISPVNSFRVVLNKYFQAGLPLLKDSTIRLIDYQ